MMKLLLPAAVLFALLPAAETIQILMDGSMNGNLVGCHCTTAPKSGLVKRAAFIREARKSLPDATLVVSTGDALEFGTDEKFAQMVLDGLKAVGYDAIAMGDQEFLVGTDFTARMMKSLPLLAGNLKVEGWLKDTAFPAHVVRTAGRTRVAFLAVIGSNTFRYFPDKKLKEKLKIESPVATVKAALPNLFKEADVVVLLTHQGLDADLALARELSGTGVALILGGHSQDLTRGPTAAGGIPILHAGAAGNWQVEARFKVDGRKLAVEKVRYHFFKYPDGTKPVTKEVILGEDKWTYETVIHENPVDDPAVAEAIKPLLGGH